MNRLFIALLVLVVPVVLTVSRRAAAQDVSAADRAAAQVLFDEGRELFSNDQFSAACPKFAESFRLEPALGTQLNLANCYEKMGRTASAWIHFVEAAASAKRANHPKRVEIAQQRAALLEPRLCRLTINVEATTPGLVLERDGEPIGQPQWGSAVPVDPGSHVIEARAPGKLPWRRTIELAGDGDEATLTLRRLQDAPDLEPAKPPQHEPDSSQLVAGIVVGVVALGGIAVGSAFGVKAMNDNDESLGFCPSDPNRCSPEGIALRNDALTAGNVSTVGFAVGGAALVTSLIVLLTAPDEVQAVTLAPTPGGVAARWRW